jgi:hypothetical protein
MRRHYHVEDTDGRITAPISSFRTAVSEARQMVEHARRTGNYDAWRVDWHDTAAGYHRWQGHTADAIGDFFDYIQVIPCNSKAPH